MGASVLQGANSKGVFHSVNQSAVRIHADVLLVAEVPLVALFDGMSFRITLLFLVFRR